MIDVQTHAYGEAPVQAGELYLPAGEAALPVVCLLHGGFWRMPYARDQLDPAARDLAGRGFAVWNLGYRRVGEAGGGYPQTLLDVDRGLDLLESLARGRLDLSRVIVAGHSAGGHLALWSAARHRSGLDGIGARVRPRAVAGLAPAADLGAIQRLGCGRDAAGNFLGGSEAEVPERYRAADPRALLPLGVPQLVLHGDEDDTIPIAVARDYAAAARAAGDAVELRDLQGVGHMEVIEPASAAFAVFRRWLEGVAA